MDELFETNPDFTCKYDMRRCTVNGKKMYCTKERIADKDMPDGWYKAEVRSSDHSDKWCTIEPSVAVNHVATLVSDRPFKFIDQYNVRGHIYPYIAVSGYDVDFDPDLDASDEDPTTELD